MITDSVAVDDLGLADELPAVGPFDQSRAPVGSSTTGVFGQRQRAGPAVGAARLGHRDHGNAPEQPEAERERAASLVEHRIAERGRARAHARHQTAAGQHPAERVEDRRLLERAAQVHRRVADQVHGAGAAHDLGRALVLGVVTLHDHQRLDQHAEPLAPRHRRGDEVGRLLERVGGRQHDHALGGDRREQPPVELVVGDERAAACSAMVPVMAADGTRPSRPTSEPGREAAGPVTRG